MDCSLYKDWIFFKKADSSNIPHDKTKSLSMKRDSVKATWLLDLLVFSNTKPQKLLQLKMFQWEFFDFRCNLLRFVFLWFINYGILVGIKNSLMLKLVSLLKSKDFQCKFFLHIQFKNDYCIPSNGFYFSTLLLNLFAIFLIKMDYLQSRILAQNFSWCCFENFIPFIQKS